MKRRFERFSTSTRGRTACAIVVGLSSLVACRAVLGIETRVFSEEDEAGLRLDAGPGDASSTGDANDASSADSDSDVSACPGDCGYCGHVCQGGACVTGVCEGRLVSSTGSPITTLMAKGIYLPFTQDTAGGRVRRVAKTGGAPTELQSGLGTGFNIALGPGEFFWAAPGLGQVGTFPLNGGARTPLVQSAGFVKCVAVSPDSQWGFYSLSPLPNVIRRVPLGGGTDEAIASGLELVTSIRASATHVYYAIQSGTNSGLYSVNFDGTGGQKIYSGAVTTFEVDENDAFVADGDANSFGRVPLTGGAFTLLMKGRVTSIALDATNTFITESGRPFVSRIPKQGGTIRGVASSPEAATHVTVDDTQVYWVGGTNVYASTR